MSIRAICDVIYTSGRMPRAIAHIVAEYARNDDLWWVAEVLGRDAPLYHWFMHDGIRYGLLLMAFMWNGIPGLWGISRPWDDTQHGLIWLTVQRDGSLHSDAQMTYGELARRITPLSGQTERSQEHASNRPLESAMKHLRCRVASAIEG